MASFVYNPYRSEKLFDVDAYTSEWWDYVQKKEFHDDLKGTLKSEANSYREDLRRNAELAGKDNEALRREFSDASERQVEAIHQQSQAIAESAKMIVGSLDNVTYAIESGFSEVSDRLDSLYVMLDWRLSVIEDQLKISNLLLENIALLLRVPDFQKERQYYIEQGFKHYKNAHLDEDLYNDALKNLLEAEERETTDYVVLHRIGMIYLYASKHLDLAKAEDYFHRAAKYAIVESNPQAQQTLNILAGVVNQDLLTQATTPETAKAVAAKSYFQAGVACYAQGKFADAVELSGKAYSLLPSFLEAGFAQAKSLAVLGNGEESAKVLRRVIQAEPFYSVKAASDTDFAPRNEIYLMLFELRNDAVHQALERFNKIKDGVKLSSQLKSIILNTEDLIQKNTYIDAVKALDELTRKYNLDELTRKYKWQLKPIPHEVLEEKFYSNYPNAKKLLKADRRNLFKEFTREIETISVEDFISLSIEVNSIKDKAQRKKEADQRNRKNEKQRQLVEQQVETQKQEAQDIRQNQARVILIQAQKEENKQNRKWFFKDYSGAISLYEQASKLGSAEAVELLKRLKK